MGLVLLEHGGLRVVSEEYDISQLHMGHKKQNRQQFRKRTKTCPCGNPFVLQAGSNGQRKYCYNCNPFGAKNTPPQTNHKQTPKRK